jgi:hypothetical protein
MLISWRFETTDYQFRKLLVPHIDSCVRFYRDIFESDRYAQTYCDKAGVPYDQLPGKEVYLSRQRRCRGK